MMNTPNSIIHKIQCWLFVLAGRLFIKSMILKIILVIPLINEAADLSGSSYVLSKDLAHIGVRVLALAGKFTGKEPLLSEFNIYMLNRNNEFDCSKAERELGFHCRPFSESIRDTVNWLREEGFLDAAEKTQVKNISLAALTSALIQKYVLPPAGIHFHVDITEN